MSAVALLPGEVLSPASVLPDAHSAWPVAELAAALGRPPAPSELAGLFRRADGLSWVLGHRVPAVSRAELGENVDRPWVHPVGMRFTTVYGSIAEVAPILRDATSPHAEVRRREELHERQQRDLHERQQAELAKQRAAGAAQTEERIRQERARRECRWSDWGPLPPEAKLAYALALALDDGKDLANELRRLGGELAKTKTLPFPERRWW